MYRPGPFALRFATARLCSYEPLREASEAAISLSARLGVMVVFAVWGNGAPTPVHVRGGPRPVNVNTRQGTVYSVTSTIARTVFAAFRRDEAMRRRIDAEFAD